MTQHAPHRSDYWTSFRDGSWKVIYHYLPSEASENSHYQLYNLAADPFEQQNLASSEPQQLQRLMQQLIDQLAAHDAVYPISSEGSQDRLTPQLP